MGGGGEWEGKIGRGGLKDVSKIVENVGGSVDPGESLEDCIMIQKVIGFLEVRLDEDQEFLLEQPERKGLLI